LANTKKKSRAIKSLKIQSDSLWLRLPKELTKWLVWLDAQPVWLSPNMTFMDWSGTYTINYPQDK